MASMAAVAAAIIGIVTGLSPGQCRPVFAEFSQIGNMAAGLSGKGLSAGHGAPFDIKQLTMHLHRCSICLR
tara:strand:- start:1009 stop:1221 length:213 start_codon:yes stop_codon:yes gene_type:complete